jgi:hypothetical protein
MTAGTVLVASLIAVLAAVAVSVLVRDRLRGKNGCGCGCGSCKKCRSPNVSIDEGCEDREENRRGPSPAKPLATLGRRRRHMDGRMRYASDGAYRCVLSMLPNTLPRGLT